MALVRVGGERSRRGDDFFDAHVHRPHEPEPLRLGVVKRPPVDRLQYTNRLVYLH